MFCPNCKNAMKKIGFTVEQSGIYYCSECGKKWIIKEEIEEEVNHDS